MKSFPRLLSIFCLLVGGFFLWVFYVDSHNPFKIPELPMTPEQLTDEYSRQRFLGYELAMAVVSIVGAIILAIPYSSAKAEDSEATSE